MSVYLLMIEVYEDEKCKDKHLYSLNLGVYDNEKIAYDEALKEIAAPILIQGIDIFPAITKSHEFEFFKRRLRHSNISMIGGCTNNRYTKNVFVIRMGLNERFKLVDALDA